MSCLSVRLSVCLPVCLHVCLSVCLSCLSVCLHVCPSAPACLVCLSVCLSACLSVRLPARMPACLFDHPQNLTPDSRLQTRLHITYYGTLMHNNNKKSSGKKNWVTVSSSYFSLSLFSVFQKSAPMQCMISISYTHPIRVVPKQNLLENKEYICTYCTYTKYIR